MPTITTDYLVIGAGAAGLAFADTLLAEDAEAHITIVDQHAKPGGHWNDAYPFVTLHQPSAFYGVNSLELGQRRIDTQGLNQGLYELATGAEICAYFERVMKDVLLASGRVSYHPMCRVLGSEGPPGQAVFVSILSGQRTQVQVRRKTVNTHYYSPSVPATHQPGFSLAPGVQLLPPHALPSLWNTEAPPRRFAILGAGKTAMDTAVWLLQAGVDADHIQWVVPRDSWLVNRITTQPAPEFFQQAIGSQADQMQALAEATSIDELFLRLEACGNLLRIDPSRQPGMFHLATVTPPEVELLRQVHRVLRLGRVQALEPRRLVLEQGEAALEPGTLCINCTASAVEPRPVQRIFQPEGIVLQIVRLPQPCFSAALTAYVEVHFGSDEEKNRLCASVPFPYRLQDYPRSMMVNLWNQFQWSQDKPLRSWVRESRLDGFGKLMSGIDEQDTDKRAFVARLREHSMAAMGNMQKLVEAGEPPLPAGVPLQASV